MWVRFTIVLTFMTTGLCTACFAAGSIAGYAIDVDNASLYEMEIHPCRAGESVNGPWGRISTDGYYELKPLAAGIYSLCLADLYYYRPRYVSRIPVRDREVTPGSFQVGAAYFVRNLANEVSPECKEIRQTFVATGNVVKITTWYPGGGGLYCSIHDAATHEQIGPARDKIPSDTFTWINGEVPTQPGRLYYVKLRRPNDEPFSIFVSKQMGGMAYPQGHAYYDGVAQPKVDIRCVIECDDDGLATFCQRQPTDGKGHGSTHVGQTFKALAPYVNVVTIFATAIEGRYAETRFSIHEEGPEGKQIGPAKTCHLWNYRPMGQVFSVTWQPGEVPVTPGKTYYLRAEAKAPGFYAFTAKGDRYPDGRCYFDGKEGNPDEDLCITILGETELYSSLSSLKGYVRDEAGKGIEGVSITFEPWGYSALTDEKGAYELPGFTAGTYAIKCSAEGYGFTIQNRVEFKPGEKKQMDFRLSKVQMP